MSKHGQEYNEHTPDGTPFGGDPKATPVGVYTPAPGVEEVVEELDRLANIYGWHHEKCAGHSHFPSCPVVKLRRMLVTLTTHQQEKEALVREILSKQSKPWNYRLDEPGTVAMVKVKDIRAIAARHGINVTPTH